MRDWLHSNNAKQWNQNSHHALLLWYIFLGIVHELVHLTCAVIVGRCSFFQIVFYDGFLNFVLRLFVGRQIIIPCGTQNESNGEFLVRHSGWFISFIIAIVVYRSPERRANLQLAAVITAVEAITTDLLRWNTFIPLISTNIDSSLIFYCGNFGIIVLHQSWFANNTGRKALDVIEKMINVTMMRGAQSGGVVTFLPYGSSATHNLKGTRSRCVNKKRTDLSKLVRNKIERDVFGFGKVPFPKGFVPVMSGHTRFATSSKATMDGTHPHQWTSATSRRVYDFHVPINGDHDFVPRIVNVENFITHNGDFDFYTFNGKTYDLDLIQKWIVTVTGVAMPATVDSCAIAGVVDVLRSQGCFGLSARYALSLGLASIKVEDVVSDSDFPSYIHFEKLGTLFEEVLAEMLKNASFESICDSPTTRFSFALRVSSKLNEGRKELVAPFKRYLKDAEEGCNIVAFSHSTINAFFDNDLFFTTRTFLKNAKGSFGLCITSSLDARRQICLASRGQTMSVAFYPNKGLICYGSEQAAVKAGLAFEFPDKDSDVMGRSRGDIDNDALRLDLDDLGGEILVLDWGRKTFKNSPVSQPNRNLLEFSLMNGAVHAIMFQESKTTTQDPQIYHRMTRLSRNPLIKPLPVSSDDLILQDIQDIPKVCEAIQDDWHSKKAATSMNRLTAYNLSRCLRERLDNHIAGKVHHRSVDIVLTGCEVSLWLAEQFAADLQKAFPRLRIKAISSNKLLGLFGQEIQVPALGFPLEGDSYSLHDSIVIIVSHSGGTFAPLSCSNLLQGITQNIFVVTSEWDTQIGKQLRKMDQLDEGSDGNLFNSRIFSTDVGIRPAEPCSISVVATHQLLTNLFEYLSVVILSNEGYRNVSAAVITEQDLQILEKCSRLNIDALADIVAVTRKGWVMDNKESCSEKALRDAGDVWAEHVLENVKAYIMTAIYIFVTVVAGYPIGFAIAYGAGLDPASRWIYLVRLLDAAIYFWLPQINVTILRLVQGRCLLHRMVGRTVVIGDIPWVAQSAEAFLSKIFACSYSIAGLNVVSGNPVDHLVHRYTHRVVRGTLLVCGRPDGRLSALSTAEASVCLAVNQASSIQSWGGTCESITIGHNPFKLVLSAKGIFLKRKRPLFLCERMLGEADVKDEKAKDLSTQSSAASTKQTNFLDAVTGVFRHRPAVSSRRPSMLDHSGSLHDASVRLRVSKKRSAAALIGVFMNFEEGETPDQNADEDFEYDKQLTVDDVLTTAIEEKKWSDRARKMFQALDVDRDGLISFDNFINGTIKANLDVSPSDSAAIFSRYDISGSGHLTYDQFLNLLRTSNLTKEVKIPPSNKDARGLIQIDANQEKYFGESIRKYNNAGKQQQNSELDFKLARNQHFSQELYETRIASLQRFVAMVVMFHQMGKRVQCFFRTISFGMLGYRMDRTHSIMRIATTASPISGSDVRQRMLYLQLLKKVQHSIHIISHAYLTYKSKKEATRIKTMEKQLSKASNSGDNLE